MSRRSVTLHTSPEGLRMVHLHVAGSAVGYCGVAVRAGSRDEDPSHHGIAHFVEHTIFKGTSRRSSWHIINRMEAVGGELNAFTTKDETVVYSAFPAGNLARAAELIADLVTESRFPDRELEKEREVVGDEIDSYLDTPSEAVFDDFEDLMFAGSSLGHNILGTRTTLATFDSAACLEYLHRWYVVPNMVVFYAGSQSADRVFKTLEKEFGRCRPGDGSEAVRLSSPQLALPFDEYKAIESHQCHTITGARIGGMDSHDRYATALLTNILGGPGMNSLLNVELRERRGLVYSVDASTGIFSDCGSLAIYYGCDPHDNDRCRHLVVDTVRSVADGYMTPRRLEVAKKQYLGQLVISGENVENHILSLARQYLFLNKITSRAEMEEALNNVGCHHLEVAADTLRFSTLTLGPKR